jgi:hypothetical protein
MSLLRREDHHESHDQQTATQASVKAQVRSREIILTNARTIEDKLNERKVDKMPKGTAH